VNRDSGKRRDSDGRRLPEAYYLDNFQQILDRVLERDRRLLHEGELRALQSLAELPENSRRLLVRLFCRREGWQRLSRMRYREIPSPAAALEALLAGGWLEEYSGCADELPEVLATLSGRECASLLSRLGQARRGGVAESRRRLEELLVRFAGRTLPTLWEPDPGRDPAAGEAPGTPLLERDRWLRITPASPLRLLLPLYFGNQRQDLSAFVTSQLGLLRFEPTRLDDRSAFADRAALDEYLDWGERRDLYHEELGELRRLLRGWRAGSGSAAPEAEVSERLIGQAKAALDLLAQVSAGRVSQPDPTAGPWITGTASLCSMACGGAGLLERLGRREEALEFFERLLDLEPETAGSSQPGGVLDSRYRDHAVKRLILDLKATGRRDEARRRIGRHSQQPRNALLAHFLERQAVLLGFREESPGAELNAAPRRALSARLLPGHISGKSRFSGAEGPCTVEALALAHYAGLGYEGNHVENRLPMSLLGLCFWDIIYMSMRGMFMHPYQAAPLDWGGGEFYQRRKTAIRERLAQIVADEHRGPALEILRSRRDTVNPAISWTGIEEDCLRAALELWPGPTLAPVLDRLLRHVGQHGRGFPDLFLWRSAKKPERCEPVAHGYEDPAEAPPSAFLLVEVKGPRDRPFLEQELWHDCLLSHGVPVEILAVSDSAE